MAYERTLPYNDLPDLPRRVLLNPMKYLSILLKLPGIWVN